MGGSSSHLPKSTPKIPYFTLTFRCPDKIQLILANDRVVETIHNAVVHCWPKGIQTEGMCEDDSYEIKFNGNPFCHKTSTDTALQSKRVCCKMLSDLLALGWKLTISSDLRQTTDYSTLFFNQKSTIGKFTKKSTSEKNKSKSIVCISISSWDGLQLVNGDDNLKSVFKQAIITGYQLGIHSETHLGLDYEIKLVGSPWHTPSLEESISSRKLLLELFRRFSDNGYQFYGTANLKETADCIFFINEPVTEKNRHMLISLNGVNRLRLIDCPRDVIDKTKSVISRYWQQGLKSDKELVGAHEFKLEGSPWWADGEDTVQSRFLITMIIQKILSLGWDVVTSVDVSRRLDDKSVLIFKSCKPASIPYFCISLNEMDKLRLINAEKEVTDMVRNVIIDNYQAGLRKEKLYHGSYQFQLNSDPWSSRGDNLSARSLMCFVLKNLVENGCRVVCSADVSAKYRRNESGPDYPLDVHSWFVACPTMSLEDTKVRSRSMRKSKSLDVL